MRHRIWITDQQNRLRQKYAAAISKKLGGRIGARFYQIDDYLSTGTRLELLNRIPFVGDHPEGNTPQPSGRNEPPADS